MAEKQKSLTLLPKILNGGIAGFIGVCCVFPLDLVKTRLQNQTIGPHGEKMYSNILDALVKTFKREGFFGMYQGLLINLLLIMPEKAIKLASNDFYRFHLKKADGSLPMYRQIIAGAGTAITQLVVSTPMELIKIQMQDQGRITSNTKSSTLQFVKKIFKKDGISGIFTGLHAAMLRDVPFSMIYFPLFANVNDMCPVQLDGDAVVWCTMCAGLFAGGTAAISVTPFDVVKTRLQTLEKRKNEEFYTGVPDAIVKIWKKEGWKAFFKGGTCRIMVIAPMFGIVQVVYYLGIAEFILGMEKHV